MLNVLVALALVAGAQERQSLGAFGAQIEGLAAPVEVAVDGAGRMHVVEELGCRVSVLEPDGANGGARVRSYGSGPGSGPGELRDPRGIALAPDGRAFVADAGNHRVCVFDAKGRFLSSFGRRGAGAGELCRPEALALELDGEGAVARVIVADRDNARLALFDGAGRWLGALGPLWPASARLGSPAALTLDSAGRLWVADELHHRVLRLNEDGMPELVLGAKGAGRELFDAPAGLAAHGGRIYVSERENHRVQVLAEEDGRTLDEFGLHALIPAQGEGRLHFPEGLGVDPAGRFLALAEPLEDRLQRFDRGELAPLEALPADAGAHFGARLDARADLVALAEPARPSVLVYDTATGEAIQVGRMGRYGTAFGALLAPVDVALTPDGRALLVADEGARRLSLFRLRREPGAPLRYDPALGSFALSLDLERLSADPRWTSPWPIRPTALELGPRGEVWLLDSRSQRLLRFSPELELEAVIAPALPDPEHARPSDLALGPGPDEIVLVDAGGRRLVVVERDGALVRTIERDADGAALFARPFGACFAEDGVLWVVDEGADRVLALDREDRVLRRVGSTGFGRLRFRRPSGIAAAGERVLVLDHGNHRVQVLDLEGRFVDAFGPRLFVLPALQDAPEPGAADEPR